jgi:hypothetical protein
MPDGRTDGPDLLRHLRQQLAQPPLGANLDFRAVVLRVLPQAAALGERLDRLAVVADLHPRAHPYAGTDFWESPPQ